MGQKSEMGGSETELIVVLQRAGFFLIHTAHEERTRLRLQVPVAGQVRRIF